MNQRKSALAHKAAEEMEDGKSDQEIRAEMMDRAEEDKYNSNKIDKDDEFLEHIADSLVKAFFIAAVIKIFLYFYNGTDS
jgi:hypothetical protein